VYGSEKQLKALMMRSLAGDGRGTRELLTAFATLLRAYFRRRMPDGADGIEDLVQETLLAVHLKRETFDPAGRVTVWVYAIARHKLFDWYRRRRMNVMVPIEEVDALLVHDGPEELASRADLARLLAGLPEKQAAAIRCTKIDGLSLLETAARTGQSEGAVKVAVHRGLRRLTELIKGRNEN
jgi:RNA polymerase sigma-70 factor (ECF subfamily)